MNLETKIAVGGGAAAAVAAIVYFVGKKAADTAKKVVEPAAKAIAAPIIAVDKLLHDDPIETLGNVVLPNGNRVPLASLRIGGDFKFISGGATYKLTQRRSDNDYDSIRV